MIYLIHGDIQKGFEKAGALVDSMLKKKPNSEVFKINTDNFDIDMLTELIGGQSLFTKKYIVQMSRLLEDEASAEIVMDSLKDIAASENVFIWVEDNLTKAHLNKIEKVAEKVQEIKGSANKSGIKNGKTGSASISTSAGSREFNVFDITDAFGQRDKKKMWLLYRESLGYGRVEEVHGVLWWQLKSIILASKTANAKEAGMKDFPYKKAKRFAANFSEEELNSLSDQMIEIYHEARRSGADLEVRLERFLLGI